MRWLLRLPLRLPRARGPARAEWLPQPQRPATRGLPARGEVEGVVFRALRGWQRTWTEATGTDGPPPREWPPQ